MESAMTSTCMSDQLSDQQSHSSSKNSRQELSQEPSAHLAAEVADALVKNGYLSAADFQSTSDGFTVHLIGTVSSFYCKAMAQTIAAKVPGVQRVANELQVVRDERASARFSAADGIAWDLP